MSKINYTKEQALAINSRGDNLLISAAAGSGKTMVLVDRVIKIMVEERLPIEKFLIVTFTNVAARQMQDKIRDKLLDLLKEGNDPFIRQQLEALTKANISTLHSFCIKVLREFYEYLGISPDFRIANTASEGVLKSQAMEASLAEEYSQAREDFLEFFYAYCDGRENKYIEIIDKVYSSIQSQIDPIGWLEESAAGAKDYLQQSLLVMADQLSRSIGFCEMAIMEAKRPGGPGKYVEVLEDDIAQYQALIDLAGEVDFHTFRLALDDIDYKTLPQYRKKEEKELLDEEIKKKSRDYREQGKRNYRKLKDELANKDEGQLEYEEGLSAHYLSSLARLVKAYDSNFKGLKERENVLTFSDLEHLTLAALDLDLVRKKLHESIDYIFYDEYQDINPIQEAIISKIQKEDNLFFVGDIKQSIYKFRLADPSIFNMRYEAYKAGQDGRVVDLSDNFRSSPVILKFLNFIFEDLMTKRLGEVDYRAPGQALTWLADKEDDGGRVDLIINESVKDKEYGEIKENARFVAEEIKRLVGQGYEYRDIVVLLRNVKNRIEDYEQAFDLYGIPYYSDVSNIGLDRVEVSTVIDLLRIISNYRNDQALLSVLLTPIGGFNEEELAEIRADSKDDIFYKSLLSYDGDEEIKDKIISFLARIEGYRKDLKRMGLAEFTYHVLEDSGYLSYIGAGSGGQEKLQNIYAFIDRIEEYEDMAYSSLEDFLRYVDTLLRSPSDSLEPTKLLSENDNLVRIMTIHKSKGLEFPVVFMGDMEREISYLDKNNAFAVDDDLGIGVKLKDLDRKTSFKTIHRKTIDYKKDQENLSEEMRLLYVGTTRAEERLYLVGSVEDPSSYLQNLLNKSLNFAISESKSMMDWYMSVAVRDKTFTDQVKSQLDLSQGQDLTDYFKGSGNYKLRIIPYESLRVEAGAQARISQIISPEYEDLYSDFDQIFQYQYPHEEDTKRPLKSTVSELSAANRYKTDDTADFPKLYSEENQILETVPDLMKVDEGLSPLARGSLVHFVFQNISYQDHDLESVRDEINRMVQMELIGSEEAEALDPMVFVNFFKSDLGKRALKNINSLEREKSFTMKTQGLYVDGQIDAYFIEDDKIVIYDFKTDRTMDKERYRDQMAYYSRALTLAYDKEVSEKYIYWVRFNKSSRID